jgi:Tfp pilus assembly protein PilX
LLVIPPPRHRRIPERGSALVLSLVILAALGALAMLTANAVRGGIQTVASDRFHQIAMYAAESGGAAAMDYLRANLDPKLGWSALVSPSNETVTSPDAIAGNRKLHGEAGNPFSADVKAHYSVELLNNRSDSGYATGDDNDKRIIIRSTGYGPDNAMAIIEWEVQEAGGSVRRPCPVYAQKGQAEDNSGRNDCLGAIDTSQSGSFTP